jgi:hypothetical protein
VRRVHLDKISSVTKRLDLPRHAVIGTEIPARAGTIIAARVLNSKTSYNTLEDVHGRFVTLHPGDVIAGSLGDRDALYGYSGRVPEKVSVGDKLFLLNLGGVIGEGAQPAPGIGAPFELEVLGSVLEFPHLDTRVGIPACVQRAALPPAKMPKCTPPILALLGTCMDSGKTTAAAVMIAEFVRSGMSVAAGKLTGVSLRRDILAMEDCGASPVSLFTDFGVITTTEDNAVAATHSLIDHLCDSDPDLIVLEMGDGLLGTYGVNALLSDAAVAKALNGIVLCAQDPVGAWGAAELLKQRYGLKPALIAGRVTDTPVGRRYCQEELGVPAWNALMDGPEEVLKLVRSLSLEGSAK